jgi:hypothetical protein
MSHARKSTPARRHSYLIGAAIAVALSLATARSVAGPTDDAEDIRDKPLDKAESKLANRGYTMVGSDARQQYWWNRGKDDCLQVHVKNGKVSHAEVIDEKQCRNASRQHEQFGSPATAAQGTSGVVGMRASYLDDEMAGRGFVNRGGHKDRDTSYTTWWNKSTRECVAVATREGRVDDVRSVSEGNCR